MKKLINLAIFLVLSTGLIILSIIFIKPVYLVNFKGEIYDSNDKVHFSFENKKIEYEIQDNRVDITTYDGKAVYNYETKEMIIISHSVTPSTLSGTYDYVTKNQSISFSNPEAYELFSNYTILIPEEIVTDVSIKKANTQKIICIILSVIISFILAIMIYPKELYELTKNNKNLLIASLSLTIVLLISSGFYIYLLIK